MVQNRFNNLKNALISYTYYPIYLKSHSISPTQISNLFQCHVYDFAGSFVYTKTIIAVFLTALEGSL